MPSIFVFGLAHGSSDIKDDTNKFRYFNNQNLSLLVL